VAEGIMEKNALRQFRLDQVTLRTCIAWEGNAWEMSRADELQHPAREECFDANSVRAEIRCEPLD
jgi:organic hydroperoxide reductase OsmC/OhrA